MIIINESYPNFKDEFLYNSMVEKITYNKNDISSDKENSFECLSEANGTKKFDYSNEISSTESIFNTESNDSKLRVYRTAITTTSQYSNLFVPITADTDEQKKRGCYESNRSNN